MTKLATLTGHTLRVLYLAVSPDGQTIVTGAGEYTMPQCVAASMSSTLWVKVFVLSVCVHMCIALH